MSSKLASSKGPKRPAPYPRTESEPRSHQLATTDETSLSHQILQAVSTAVQPLLERVERLESAASSSPQPETDASPHQPVAAASLLSPTISPTYGLPSVPARLRDRITRGEFVDLNELLPECIGVDEEDVTRLSIDSGRSVQLIYKPSSQAPRTTRRRIHDIGTWLEAFTLYSRVLLDTSPEKTQALLAYQATILEANNNYQTDAWIAYDIRFRRALSSMPKQYSWQVIDPNLWQSCFTSRGRASCPRCSLIHPTPTQQCPFRGGLLLAAGSSGSPFSSSTPSFQGKQICRNFNRNTCSNGACPRAHVCLKCRGKHSEANCKKVLLFHSILNLFAIHRYLYLV